MRYYDNNKAKVQKIHDDVYLIARYIVNNITDKCICCNADNDLYVVSVEKWDGLWCYPGGIFCENCIDKIYKFKEKS